MRAPPRDATHNVDPQVASIQEQQQAAAARQATILKISDAIRELEDPRLIQQTACRMLGEHLGVNRVIYADIRESDVLVGPGYASGVPSLQGRVPIAMFGSFLAGPCKVTRLVTVTDVVTDERIGGIERAMLGLHAIAAFAGVVLVKSGAWVGALALHSATPREWSRIELELVMDVAERVYTEGKRARAEGALRQSQEQLRETAREQYELLERLRHQLRDALSPIRTGLESLRIADSAAIIEPTREMMERQMSQLVGVIERLLDSSSPDGPAALPAIPAEAPAASMRTELTARRVLIVDDNHDAADANAMWLQQLGAECRVAYNGAAAIKSAAQFPPDIVLLDLTLPDASGEELCRWMRQSLPPNVYIIAVTGRGDAATRAQTSEAGFNAHLTKPADPKQLLQLITEPRH